VLLYQVPEYLRTHVRRQSTSQQIISMVRQIKKFRVLMDTDGILQSQKPANECLLWTR